MAEQTNQARKILHRRQAYRLAFLDDKGELSKHGESILSDLKKFCRGDTPTVMISPVSGTIDPLAMALAEGRREVWLRIMAHLKLDDTDILNLKDNTND